jgi:hypothetical protein
MKQKKGIRFPSIKVLDDLMLTWLPLRIIIEPMEGGMVQLYADPLCTEPLPLEPVSNHKGEFPPCYLDRKYSKEKFAVTVKDGKGIQLFAVTGVVLEDIHSAIGWSVNT